MSVAARCRPATAVLLRAAAAARFARRFAGRLALWLLLGACPILHAQTLTLRDALAVESDSEHFPADAPLAPVSLPDSWARTRPDASGPVWYRVSFTIAAEPRQRELLALYVEHVCTNLEVHLNGELVHRVGRMREPLTYLCGLPQLVTLPAALLAAGTNTIDVKVAGHRLAELGSRRRAGELSALVVGPQSALSARAVRQTTLAVTLPQALSATLLLTGTFMFVLGFINRRESHLAYFGALSVGRACIDARLWLPTLPLANPVVEFLQSTLVAFIAWAAVQFLLRYARHRERAVDLLLPLQCAAMPLALVAAGPEHLYAVASAWYLLFGVEVLAAAAYYLRSQWRLRRPTFGFTAALVGATLLSAAVEFVAQRASVPSAVAQIAQLVTPLMLVLVGLRLMQQHGRALHAAEIDKAALEQRVREATAQIEHSFRQLAELRVEQVTERERKRIAADLHDDLGAKLLTIVHTSESERISTLAREALEEMRLSVRGLTGKPVRLADALGDWRAEVVSRLAQAGVEAEWSAPEDLPQLLSARAYVQTTRILREATSNVIKHSGATRCMVRCSIAEGDLQLVVQDNGEGIPLELDGRLDRGHGMAGMKHRAKQLQGQCLVESGPGYGTVIRLTVPLNRALEMAPIA
jgi:signal transduction histidine kinase